MTNERYGVMALLLEFWLSVIVFVGGGLLIWHDNNLMAPIFGIWGGLITFWFSRRQAEASNSNLMSAMQAQQSIQPVPPQVQPIEQVPIIEQPAQPRAPSYKQPVTEEKANG